MHFCQILFHLAFENSIQVERSKSFWNLTPFDFSKWLNLSLKLIRFHCDKLSYQYRNGIKPFIKEQTQMNRNPVERALLCSALPPESEMNT